MRNKSGERVSERAGAGGRSGGARSGLAVPVLMGLAMGLGVLGVGLELAGVGPGGWAGAMGGAVGMVVLCGIAGVIAWRNGPGPGGGGGRVFQDEHDLYKSTLEPLGVVFWQLDGASGELVHVSPQIEALTGVRAEEWKEPGRWFAQVDANDLGALRSCVDEALEEGRRTQLEYRVRHADGMVRWVRSTVSPVRDAGGGIVGARGVMIDNTESRLAQDRLAVSEQLFRTMGDQAPIFIWLARADKSLEWFNKVWLDFTGRTQEEETGEGWHESIHPDDLEGLRVAFEGAVESRKPYEHQYRLRRHDGVYRDLFERGGPVYRKDGTYQGYIGSAVDITDMLTAERRMRASQRRAELHLQRTPLAALEVDRSGRVIGWNPRAEEIFGYTRDEAIGRDALDMIVPDEAREHVKEIVHELLERGVPNTSRNENLRSDGSRIICEWHNTPLPDEDGRIGAYAAFADDITLRVRDEAKLRDSEALFRFLAENAADLIARQTVDGRFLYASPAAERIFGVSAESLVGTSFFDRLHRDDRGAVRRSIEALIVGEPASSVRCRIVRGQGETITAEASLTMVRGELGRTQEIVAVVRDISRRVEAEEMVRRSRQELQTITDALPVVIGRLDPQMRLRFVNAAGRAIYGRELPDLLGEPLDSVIPPDRMELHRPHIERALSGKEQRYEFTAPGPSGGLRTMDAMLIPERNASGTVGAFFLLSDVTEAREAIRSIEAAARLRGRLLSELNHRLKNALGSLLTLVDLCRVRQSTVDGFANAIRSRLRAMDAVHSLLSERNYAPVDIETIVRTMIPPECPGSIALGGPPIDVPARQATPLGFVVQELMSNSLKHGALASSEGRVDIRWSCVEAEPRAAFPESITLDWVERGVSIDPGSVSPGLGTQLIEGFARHELRGEVVLRYAPEGVEHRLVVRPAQDESASDIDAEDWMPV
ncbi:MAG: PAS domain S-box protein [Phycisphaerales bacterium]